ncbi:MAG: cation:proton antiporter [Gammaproteobacteria bacterium]
MDILWLVFAFVCGLGIKLLGLPPLIGFLIAGFALNAVGVEPNATLDTLANLGITLMLFTIGLKLNLHDLVKREVWVGTLSHLALWMISVVSLSLVVATASIGVLGGLELESAALLAFALGFSSTVCVIKVLEESGELKTRHGRLAMAILVMQDLIAVAFLAVATGETPSIWALALIGLWFARPVLRLALNHAGHGEMLPLTGFVLALGGYELFDLVGVKGDLGALLLGMLLSGHAKASELTKSLMDFKDLFLIGFFLSIGLTALPNLEMFAVACALCLVLGIKALLFFGLLTRLGLRARTSFLAALVLSDYSEFGLIVIALCVSTGWLAEPWLVISALAVAISFVMTSTAYRVAHGFYARHKGTMRRFEKTQRLPEDQVFRPREAEILVVGTGRVGRGAFKALHKMAGDRVWGMDASRALIEQQRAQGMRVFVGDAENADIWEMIDVSQIRLVLLAVASVGDNRNISAQLRHAGYTGAIAAIARYDDEVATLNAAGIDKVFNFFTEAGAGFAEDSLRLIDPDPNPERRQA